MSLWSQVLKWTRADFERRATVINSRPETAWPVAPPTNPLKFTLAKLLKAKEASKALKRKKV